MRIQGWYWKWAGIAILLYVFTAGLLVPLNPGITQVTPFSHRAGTTATLEIQGYNTRFEEGDSLEAWLVLDSAHALMHEQLKVLDPTRIEATFELPAHFPLETKVTDLNLVINSSKDGAFVRPSAITITQDSFNMSMAGQAWTTQRIRGLNPLNEFRFPYRNILAETIRNTYFHVPLWFSMILIFLLSFVHSVRYLRRPDTLLDDKIQSLVSVGLLLGILGTLTGAVWAKFTWGAFWSWDVKQNMTAVCLLIYFAYFLLRQSITDQDRRGRVSAAYNLFAFLAMIPLLFVIPRLTESLHPGNGGNPALGGEDLDNTMRKVFYPAIIGWTLLGLWLAELQQRYLTVQQKILSRDQAD
jgi:heme exporter protein C